MATFSEQGLSQTHIQTMQLQAQSHTAQLLTPELQTPFLQSQVHPQPPPVAGTGDNDLLEALQSQGLHHLHPLLTARGVEMRSMSDLRVLANHLSEERFLDIMFQAGVGNIADRYRLHQLATRPVEEAFMEAARE